MQREAESVPVTAEGGHDPLESAGGADVVRYRLRAGHDYLGYDADHLGPAPIWDQIHSCIAQGKPAQAWWRIYIRRCLHPNPGYADQPWPHESMTPQEAAALVTAAMTGQIDTRYTLPTRDYDGSPIVPENYR